MDCFALLAMTASCSMAFEIIERLATALAAPQGLAGGGAEFRQQFGVFGTACGHATRCSPNSARRELPGSGGAMP
jgi:hypothetical protein